MCTCAAKNTTYAAFSEIDVDTKKHKTFCTGMLSANEFIHPAWKFHRNKELKYMQTTNVQQLRKI